MVAGMAEVVEAVIMAAAIVVVVMVTISAVGIMAAAIFMPDRPVHSRHTVRSPRIA
jgi:hypothetical protein